MSSSQNTLWDTPMKIGRHIRRALRSVGFYQSNHDQAIHCGTPPDPFPAELWVYIINECSNGDEWFQLYKTCRFFFQVAQACMYKDITLYCLKSQCAYRRPDHKPLSLFERSFRNRPDLRALVHKLYLMDTHRPQKRKTSLLSCLHQFPNLETLGAQLICIDTDLCYAIHSHPRLSSVSFHYCQVENSLAALCDHQFPESSISYLCIDDATYHETYGPSQEIHSLAAWAALVPTKLRSLRVSSLRRHYGVANVGSVLSCIASAGKSHMLEELVIADALKPITDFLITTPRLRRLTVEISNEHLPRNLPNIFASLPMDTIPLLEHYTGPAQFSQLLLRNRPVHTVIITHSETGLYDLREIFTSLQSSLVPVTKVELRRSQASLIWLDAPSTINHLTLSLLSSSERSQIEPFLCLSNLTDLHTICFNRVDPTVTLAREMMPRISELLPSLREIDLTHERWVMVKPSAWERYIPL